jgi:hypothetical protein
MDGHRDRERETVHRDISRGRQVGRWEGGWNE